MTSDTEGGSAQGSLLRAMSNAILAMAAERSVEPVLQSLVESARELLHARYAALGVPDEQGEGFAQFIYTGMSDELVARIGPLPRTHGLLAAMLKDTEPYKAKDVQLDPRFDWWPDAHPRMSSFLGVPILSRGKVIGAFYLTDKIGADEFSESDQETIEMLAAHAAVAIENAQLLERSRELSVIEERNRLARELHDSVAQALFSMSLTAEATVSTFDEDPDETKRSVENIRDLARSALREMRSLIFELRPVERELEGLVSTLKKHLEVVRRVTGKDIVMHEEGYVPQPLAVERELFRIIQEALNNAVKHSQASHIGIELALRDERILAAVSDDGVGFDPSDAQIRTRRLGITSMEERSAELGGELTIESSPANGTKLQVVVPVG